MAVRRKAPSGRRFKPSLHDHFSDDCSVSKCGQNDPEKHRAGCPSLPSCSRNRQPPTGSETAEDCNHLAIGRKLRGPVCTSRVPQVSIACPLRHLKHPTLIAVCDLTRRDSYPSPVRDLGRRQSQNDLNRRDACS